MKPLEHLFAVLGFLTFLLCIAVLYDILTNGDRRLWNEATYPGGWRK